MDKESRDKLIQTRWSWQQLLLVAVGLFALLFGVDFVSKGLLFPGHGTTAIYIRAVIRFTYALIAAGIVYYGLGGAKLLKRPTPLTAFLKIMITIIGVLLVLLLVLSNFPYRLVAMVHSKFFIADTLVALSAGIFEEFTCRGLLLSAFVDAFRLSRHPLYLGSRDFRSLLWFASLIQHSGRPRNHSNGSTGNLCLCFGHLVCHSPTDNQFVNLGDCNSFLH